MIIGGIQKMTLLDFPGKMACIVFTAGCNFRCPFCHNSELVVDPGELMDESEFFDFLNKRKNMLEGVCVTGGEPLIHKDIDTFISKIKDMNMAVKLDTNGSNPEYLKRLCNDGLVDYVAMDVKNCRDRYSETCGCSVNTDLIDESINFLISGNTDYEFRTTMMKEFHDVNSITKMGKWINGAKRHFIQSYKESDSVMAICQDGMDKPFNPVEKADLQQYKTILKQFIKEVEIRG